LVDITFNESDVIGQLGCHFILLQYLLTASIAFSWGSSGFICT